ncbi:MAG: M48 family metallopeptidase [Chitinophagaceae bacterium]
MKTWFASYYTSFHAEPAEATVLAVENSITIGFRVENGVTNRVRWEMQDLAAVFDNSLQATRISHTKEPDSRLIVNGKQALEFIQQMQAEQNKSWYKKSQAREWGRNLLIFSGIITVLITTYFLIVPWLSEKLASTISANTEQQIGNAVYDALDLSAQEDKQATAMLNQFFQEMKVPTAYTIHITVVKSYVVNAFALPGGNIVVYTALLKELKTYPELAALLSHEFTHVNNKHSTKSIFRQLGSKVFISLLFGRFGSVTSVMVDQADKFKSLKYSRGLEKEADLDGLSLLKEKKIDPAGFIGLFKHLKNAAPASTLPEFLGSHPDIDKRIAYIREASKNFEVEENSSLKTIFEKIN